MKIQDIKEVNSSIVKAVEKKPFLLMAPGITPVYANNPAFRLVSYNKETLELSDYTQYKMDLTLSNGIVMFSYNICLCKEISLFCVDYFFDFQDSPLFTLK